MDTIKVFVYFVTACQCAKMEMVLGEWDAPPTIDLPLIFPVEVHDWVNPETDSDFVIPEVKKRTFRLEQEDFLQDKQTKIFTYREVEH
jgi:hypothetical protein